MESLNLNTLASSLPPSNNAQTEKSLLDDFKAAAASVTTLYRSSLKASKRSYDQGYAAACHEVLAMIQQGVSDHADPALHVGRVMDWLEARLDALRAREEEEEEDEERSGPSISKPQSIARATSAPVPAPKDTAQPHGPSKLSNTIARQPSPPSPPLRSASQPALAVPATRAVRARPSTPALRTAPPAPAEVPFVFDAEAQVQPLVPHDFSVSAGAKRRHAVMMMLDAPGEESATTTVGANVGTRRRTKSTRTPQGQSAVGREESMMDIEEEGRERKRAARR